MNEGHNGAGGLANIMSNRPLIVGLLFLGTYFAPFLILIGLPLAYVFRRSPEEDWELSHFQFLIRTFWIAILLVLLFGGLAALTSLALPEDGDMEFVWAAILVLGIGLAFAFSGVRIVISIMKSSTHRPIANPRTWLI